MERDTSPLTLALFDLLELNEKYKKHSTTDDNEEQVTLFLFFGVEEEEHSRA